MKDRATGIVYNDLVNKPKFYLKILFLILIQALTLLSSTLEELIFQ